MTTAAITSSKISGGAFLIEEFSPDEVFTAEDLSEEHLAIAHTVDGFWANDVEPHLDAIRQQKPGVALSVLRKSAEIGLTAVAIPERFGGMEMDLASVMIVGEHMGKDASYASWHSAHTGIGTLPILFFGTEEQKQGYLPRLAKAEILAAYALTEPLAGSDALAVRTRADLSSDGKHYVLNGQKMWITNGGAADLFSVLAKVRGESFTAFLVERGFPGVSSGAEEHKMGIKGSSTTVVYFDNVRVPVENVLGEVGRGQPCFLGFCRNLRRVRSVRWQDDPEEERERMNWLCTRIQEERDPETFHALVHELNELRTQHLSREPELETVSTDTDNGGDGVTAPLRRNLTEALCGL
ncbi:MAG: acyl-CoA dehydrogenase family protein [Candidatus Sulfotelmatobacter sp.]